MPEGTAVTDQPGPKQDQPFPDDVIRYCAERLFSLGIQPDREWLWTDSCPPHLLLIGGDQQKMAIGARTSVPRTTAIWETSELYRWAMPLAIFDVMNGPMDRFEHFELLYLRILGDEARRWLPSLYLAAISSPSLGPEHRIQCFNRFIPYRLDVEQEIADRQARLGGTTD